MPVPFKLAACGDPDALSVMVVAPVNASALKGVNVTLIVQFAPAANVPPQVVVLAKFPVVTMLEMVSAAVPTFVNVSTVAALVLFTIWFPKAMDEDDKLTTGKLGADMPVPESEMTWGVSAASSTSVIVPLKLATLVGVNVTETLQEAEAASVEPHVVVSAKAPEGVMLVMFNVAEPVFVSVTVRGWLVVFSCWPGKVMLEADSWTIGAEAAPPSPLKVITCGLPIALSVIVVVPVEATALVGWNVTEMVQDEPAARLDVQVVVLAKGDVVTMLVIDRLKVPVLVSVTT